MELETLVDTPTDNLAEVEGETLAAILGDVEIEALVDTLVDRLVDVETEKLADTLGDVDADALVDTDRCRHSGWRH